MHHNQEIILWILQVVTIYNAMILGWNIRKISDKRYELTKNINELTDFELKSFVKKIVSFKFVSV